MSSAVALLLTDTLPTAWAAVVNAGDPAGKSFAVVGAGPVGQQVIAVAYALGAAVVYAVDFDERRLASAAKLGAVAVPGKDQPGERILELTGGRGVDVSFDAVGSQAAVNTAMTAVARGGALGLVGAFLGGDLVFAVQQLMHKNVEVHPIMGNPYASEHLITGLLTSGRLSLDEIVDVEVALAEAPAAYEAFASRTINKAVLLPQA
jgi:threonine dehydrogenase-like Zn-dependent dehydrogenase